MDNIKNASVEVQDEPQPEPGKPWYLSKTLWVNVLVVVAAILAYLMSPEVINKLPGNYTEYVTIVLGIVNIFLRFLTNEPLKK